MSKYIKINSKEELIKYGIKLNQNSNIFEKYKKNKILVQKIKELFGNVNMNSLFDIEKDIIYIGKFSKNILSYKNALKEVKNLLKKEKSHSECIDEKAMIDYVKNNKVAIHTPTEEDYKRFTDILDKNGERWGVIHKLLFKEFNCFMVEKCNTYLSYHTWQNWGYGHISYVSRKYKDIKILTVQQLFDKFKKYSMSEKPTSSKAKINIYPNIGSSLQEAFKENLQDKEFKEAFNKIQLEKEEIIETEDYKYIKETGEIIEILKWNNDIDVYRIGIDIAKAGVLKHTISKELYNTNKLSIDFQIKLHFVYNTKENAEKALNNLITNGFNK